jgi:S-DNA-T family DNA segregation ATPase FtsK/SpoIIIE
MQVSSKNMNEKLVTGQYMTAMSGAYAQRLIMTLFLISFGIYLFLATVTYTPFDPGWMHISSDTQQVSNASGVAGAWIADLLFGFLGWASLLIPVFLFMEAVQVWWPHSFLNKPFRYAAQFFILLATASLLFLFWDMPADTLENASGGIIGYELGQSLSQILTVYGAAVFLILFWVLLFTLAFGVKWNRTWATLKATPAYLQDLFYKNVPVSESAFDRTTPAVNTHEQAAVTPASDNFLTEHEEAVPEIRVSRHHHAAERLFDDMVEREQKSQQLQWDDEDEQELEQTIAKAHQLEQDSQKIVGSGEVWRALKVEDENHHKKEIDALLRAAEEDDAIKPGHHFDEVVHPAAGVQSQTQTKESMDWNDDAIFDELLAAVPGTKTATDIHTPFNSERTENSVQNIQDSTAEQSRTVSTPVIHTNIPKNQMQTDEFDELDDLLVENIETERTASSYAQSSAFVKADIQTDLQTAAVPVSSFSDEEKQRVASDKDAFRDAWQGTAGIAEPEPEQQIEEDDFDLDAPLKDAFGRPMSRAMQVARKRLDLSPLPGLDILDKVDPNKKVNFTAEQLARLSELLEIKLQEFNVKAKVIEAQPGPVVTRFELDLAPGVKASKVTNISRDLARSMSMASVRVVEVIPGKPYIGIEVPNSTREMVRLIELLETPAYRDPDALLSMAMGKDISGNPVLADLAKAPHMLVAGTTGSGKSVAVNAMLLSMLLKYTPEQLRLIMIDPKQLELANYNDIPHLLTPVVTDMKDAVSALNWCVNEMERRYKLMSMLKVRKLTDYNRKVEEAIANGEDLIDPTWKPEDTATQSRAPRLQPMPLIVIVADEFADMIMQVGKKAEEMITRLAQKSRAAGIHLLLATQRPTVDVVTGLIKANIPTRAALRVNSKLDSRTILDAGGAEDLLGHGDMLFLGPGKIEPERVHGAFISDDEVNRICDAWRERGDPDYVDEILTPYDEEPTSRGFEDGDSDPNRDALYDQCVSFVLETRKVSVSSLQRKFSLGYNRAARIVDQMEENGIVGAMGANGKRDILV